MFNSGISASELIKGLKNEVDIAIPIPNSAYVSWLNSLEQLLYSEYIQEQKEITVEFPENNVVNVSELTHGENESAVRFEDIYAVYEGNTQFIKSTLTSGAIFPNTYYKTDDNLGVSAENIQPESLRIIYFVRPALKNANANDNIGTGNVMLPIEFIDLAKAKLRGEAYKLANEDALAAKWINDYNVLLETFKMWISDKQPQFGM